MKEIEEKIESVKNSQGEILELNGIELSEIPQSIFKLKNLKILRLRKNKIKCIPDEISSLSSLVELNLIDNELTSIPVSLFQLKNLQVLHLRKNKITSIPNEISELISLTHLNIGNNELTSLPETLGDLSELIHLFVKNNQITRLPKSLKQLEKLKDLYIGDNPIIYPPENVLRGGLMRIMIFLILEDSESYSSTTFTFKIPKELKTAIKQYISFFPDYVEIAKGKNMRFEAKSSEDGITIEIEKNSNIEEVNEYFNEYLGFVKTNLDTLQPKIETEISQPQKDLLLLELKQQINHLRQQVEFKNFQVKYLEQQVGSYYNLLSIEKANPNPIFINTYSQANATSESSAELNSEITMNLKIEIPNLQKNLLETKLNLPVETSKALKEEFDAIDHELMEQTLITNISDVNNVPLKKIKRLFDQLTDEKSEFNSIIKKSKNLKNSIQQLGKSYNKIAQWIGLPVVPDLLLEI